MSEALHIRHYSDLLCIWAYIAQQRMDELQENFGPRIQVDYGFVNVFGHARDKLSQSWSDRGGLGGYAAHVQEVAGRFAHVSVSERAWAEVAPASSLPAHQFLAAIRRLARDGVLQPDPARLVRDASWALRLAFFQEARDISRRTVQLSIAEALGLPRSPLEAALDDGTAMAELSHDLLACRDETIRTSPTLLLNEGRQRLTGNVGYRVIEANVRELLERPGAQAASWC